MHSAETPPGNNTNHNQMRSPCRTFEQNGLAFEPHFSPGEVAEMWGLSDTKVRRMFQNEPGVLRVGEPSRRLGRKLKRSYYTLRIPESVARRVHNRLSQSK